MPIPILPKALSCKLSDPRPALHSENCVSDPLIFILFASKAAVQLVANPFVAHAVDERGIVDQRFHGSNLGSIRLGSAS